MGVKNFMSRMKDGETVLLGEGYLFEMERRGYLSAGAFVPEVVLEFPHLVRNLYEEFAFAGSDIVQAFTYYGNRQKMQVVGRDNDVEALNRKALKMAKEVAVETNTLMAGNICNSTSFNPKVPESYDATEKCFKEQIEWAVDEGADMIIAETYSLLSEARLALRCIQKYGKGVPSVVNLAIPMKPETFDGVPAAEACRLLEEEGASVVGLNCFRGPQSILPLMKEIRQACKGPISCLPVPYRTDEEHPTFQSIVDSYTGKQAFPYDLDAWFCNRSEIEDFTRQCTEIGVQFVGLCCGGSAHSLRSMAEVLGRKPPGSRFSPRMELHGALGDAENKGYSTMDRSYRNELCGKTHELKKMQRT